MSRSIFIAIARGAALIQICAAFLASQQKPDIRLDVDLVTIACAVDTSTGTPTGNLKPHRRAAEDHLSILQENGQ
jgi:hypothetical protein